ncbi:MAG: magnesium/cobalt transporter CorA [Elusimicrobia bacterium]|nr:magnesium/cobalt transporter CorA [Elusimicrobiota bacterium]
MTKLIKKMSSNAGMPPGTLISRPGEYPGPVKINIFDFTEDKFTEKDTGSSEDFSSYGKTRTVTWINVNGIHDAGLLEKIGEAFGLHPLLLEDITNTESRPKLDAYDDYIFIILKMLYMKSEYEIESEQVSIVLKDNVVISFQEKEGDVFGPVRDRIRNAKGKIRKMGADYLAYALIDAIVDNYFVIPERLADNIEVIEDILLEDPKPEILQTMHKLRRDMIFLRKSVWPLREVVNSLVRGDSGLFKDSTVIYLRDVYDNTVQVMDALETFRDVLSGLMDMYMTGMSNKMNEVMKTLTIIATIFIPLTFIAGIYGMNFSYMPELGWKSGYFFVLGIMAVIVIIMVVYFKKKKWM